MRSSFSTGAFFWRISSISLQTNDSCEAYSITGEGIEHLLDILAKAQVVRSEEIEIIRIAPVYVKPDFCE